MLAADPGRAERRLHPWSWLFVLVQQLKQFVVPLVALLVLGRGDRYMLYPLIGVGVLALISVWQYFTYRYRIADDSLVVRSGVFERSLRQIPFARIHNVALHQSLLHRLFGVAEVRLESAGGQKPEAQMRVLQLADALALERLIRHRGVVVADAQAAQANPEDAAETLLSLPTAEVVRLGLVSNRGMVVVAGAFALSWQVFPDDVVEDGFRRIGRDVFGYASQYAGELQLGWAATGVAALAVVLLAVVVLRAFSVAIALVQFHGFTLQAHGRRLTVERGLLTRLRTSASRRRIQAWTLEEGLLHRLLRRRGLHVDIAVSEQQNERRALRELAPIATPGACDALVQRLLPRGAAWPPPAWRSLHPHAWLRLWLPGLLLSGLATAGLTWRFGALGLLALAWIPWAAFAARQHARRAGYARDAHLVAVREGWWSRHWRFAEIDKLQALQFRQSPLDRRMGMASVWLDTAGAGSMGPPLRVRLLPEAQARELYDSLSRIVAARPLRW
ncbi:PH domain-containing protein [Luteimonas vadosa]|uniref:PH domain-containing protein n=1 Tax=Luteimonas vadosa TaxID=1165507 RepID=A0ABP9DQI7_9GAMM